MDSVGDAVLVVGEGLAGGEGLDGVDGVAHGDAEAGVLDHGEVVDLVADGGDALQRDLVLAGDPADAGPLAGIPGEDLEDVELLAVQVAGVLGGDDSAEVVHHGAVAEGSAQVGDDPVEGGAQAADAEAHGVLGVLILGDRVDVAVLDAHVVEPPEGDGVEGEL